MSTIIQITRVDGITYCRKHDDFAIEGYDWSDVCHEAWVSAQGGNELGPCDLVPMHVEHNHGNHSIVTPTVTAQVRES